MSVRCEGCLNDAPVLTHLLKWEGKSQERLCEACVWMYREVKRRQKAHGVAYFEALTLHALAGGGIWA